MNAIHQNLANGKWNELTLVQQLANIGAEYSRYCASKDLNMKQQAQARLLELLDLTIANPRFHQSQLKELVRLREVACDDHYAKVLQSYFLPFALASRK